MVVLHFAIAEISDVLLREKEEGAVVEHYAAIVFLLGFAHEV